MSNQLFQRVINWAATEETIRVIILEGSHARLDRAEDRFSDYDLDLYVTDTLRFAQDGTWLTQLGQIWAMEKESAPDGVVSRLVLFAGGRGVDFRFLPINRLHELVEQQTLPDDYHRGYQVYDTWIAGKNMKQWVAADLWQAFFGIFAHFDKADSWRAVCALMPLYRRLASETAQQLHYAYPVEMDQAIANFIMADPPVSFTENAGMIGKRQDE